MFNLVFMAGAVYRLRNYRHLDDQKPTASANWRLRRWWSAPTACATSPSPAMSTIPVGVAYSLWCGFGIVGVTICSMILYKQKPDRRPLSPWR